MSRINRFSFAVATYLAISVLLAVEAWAHTSSEKVLYNFTGNSDGGTPSAALIFDANGNLYGTTEVGGRFGMGTVFELLRMPGGAWQEIVLHSFAGYPTDGSDPQASLIFDQSGNLFGTTAKGGANSGGIAFELSPSSGEIWNETVLYNFNCCSGDALEPVSGLFLDESGNLFGTTLWGGTGGGPTGCDGENMGCGAFFELTNSGGGWKESVLYSFGGSPDAALPHGNLARDTAGNFYDTSLWGGATDFSGTVFELSPTPQGGWSDTVIYTNGSSETGEIGGVIFDKAGNLYGTGESIAFELSPSSPGWTENTLHTFTGGVDGANVQSGLVIDGSGNLYGTTAWGGGGNSRSICRPNGCGTVFKLDESSGAWQETVLYSFRNGSSPTSGVILDAKGNLYGTTPAGGVYGYGVVYKITQ